MKNTPEPLSAIRKSCRILSSLTDPRTKKLTEIAAHTGLDVSTVLRILKDLEEEGFVEREPETKDYTLGTQVYAMHHAMVDGLDLRALARPALIRLSRRFGDSVVLSVPSGWESVCIDICLGDYPIRANYLDVGSRRPLGVGAGSLALLAALSTEQAAAVWPMVVERLKARYPAFSQSRLKQEVARARQCGYALLTEVVVEKMGGLGVAILGPGGQPMGALSVAALTERIVGRETELVDALDQEARAIERAWSPAAA